MQGIGVSRMLFPPRGDQGRAHADGRHACSCSVHARNWQEAGPPEPARYAVSCFVMATVTRACARCMALNARR